jgi:hypothetical protein
MCTHELYKNSSYLEDNPYNQSVSIAPYVEHIQIISNSVCRTKITS